jgi:S-formylglutathione hydrolase FrmB
LKMIELKRTVFLLMAAIMASATFTRAGGYQTVTFVAQHLGGMKVSANVILPRGYAASNRRFPVLYLVDGYSGNYTAWVAKSHIVQYAQKYEEIIFMPEYGATSWYVNSYVHPSMRWEDYMIKDVIPYVDSHYPTIASRAGRAIVGDSMGGYGALMLGLKHANLFAAAASLSGTLRCAEWDPAKIKIPSLSEAFGPFDNPARAAVDPFKLVKTVPPALMPQIYFSIGEQDGAENLGDNRAFAHLLAQLKIPYRYCEVPGGHQWPVWELEIQHVLAIQAPVLGVKVKCCQCDKREPDQVQHH